MDARAQEEHIAEGTMGYEGKIAMDAREHSKNILQEHSKNMKALWDTTRGRLRWMQEHRKNILLKAL